MNNFCPECGFRLAENFNFCPNCGSEIITADYSNDSADIKTSDAEVILCENCGDENPLDSVECNSCGVKFYKSKIKTAKSVSKKNIDSQVKVEKTRRPKITKQKSQKREQPQAAVEKKLDKKSMYGLIASVIGIIAVILIFSGVIDLSEDKTKVAVTQPNINSGIDLSLLTRINELKAQIEREPTNNAIVLELANLQFDSGFFEEASRNYSKYLQTNPQNADARIDMAVCFYNMQQFEKAEAAILEALKYSPKHQTGFLNLGIVYLAQQKVDVAKEWFKKAIELNPNTEVANRARSLLQTH